MTGIDEELKRAHALYRQGAPVEALGIITQVYPQITDDRQKVDLAAFAGMAFGRLGDRTRAETWFEEALSSTAVRADAIHFERGAMREEASDAPAALESYCESLRSGSRNARHFLAAGQLLDESGQHAAALNVWSLGDSLDPMLRQAQFHPQADDVTKARSRQADGKLRAHFSALHRRTIDQIETEESLNRVRDAVWVQTHDGDITYAHEDQKPQFFYMPGLNPVPSFEPAEIPWADDLNVKAHDIKAEFLAAMENGLQGSSYIGHSDMRGAQWDHLRGQKSWEALHLFKEGQAVGDLADQFPSTINALEDVPLVRVDGQPLEVFFSVLKPGTHIPPHFGLANSRLTVHLPLIVPDRCGIRVSSHTHHWKEGEVFAFDDSFEHEAWNQSADTRVVLIFEAWSPLLTENECTAISASFEARIEWLKQRALP